MNWYDPALHYYIEMTRILLIDDDLDFLQSLQDGLENLGHEIAVVDSGNKGLQKFNEANFDVVITDIIMNDGNGINFIESVRLVNSKVPVIAISGWCPHTRDAVEKWGADKALLKPLNISQLQTVLDELNV